MFLVDAAWRGRAWDVRVSCGGNGVAGWVEKGLKLLVEHWTDPRFIAVERALTFSPLTHSPLKGERTANARAREFRGMFATLRSF